MVAVFNNHIFTLNESMTIDTIDTPLCKITIIDDFYSDFDSVCEEIEKLPIVYTGCNQKTVLDARKSYTSSMGGTYLPYTSQYDSIIKNVIGYGGDVEIDARLLVNYSKLFDDTYKDHYFNIHQDQQCLIATVLFLNDEYCEGEGMNTYFNPSTYIDSGWIPKNLMDINHFIQGKPNRAVLFDPMLFHGVCYNTDQFKHSPRLTQVIFSYTK